MTTTTPARYPGPSGTIPDAAGGHASPVDDRTRLDRFLVLGAENGSDHATEPTLTRDNTQAVLRAIATDGPRAVDRPRAAEGIVAISEAGRAPRNDPALFAEALRLYHARTGIAVKLVVVGLVSNGFDTAANAAFIRA